VALVAVAVFSAWLGREGLVRDPQGRRPLLMWLRDQRALVIATEVLFLVVFAGWAAFRAFNPDIAGTEKPMEFAFVNGVLSSRFFPPQDPWLAGYGISYYYFGYVMLAVLIRLTGVLPEVGFNMGVALWFALVMIGAFGVVYALVGLAQNRGAGDESPPEYGSAGGRPIRWGLLGALFVGVLGNLEGIIDSAHHRGLLPSRFVDWIDIKGLGESPPTGDWTGGFWWWWRASRVIHDKDLLGNSVELIDEFPFFSFLLGDLHPHVLGYPFVLLTVALALNLLLGAREVVGGTGGEPGQSVVDRAGVFARRLGEITGLGTWGILLHAVVLGGVAFLNTWDFPIYVAVAGLAIGFGSALRNGPGRTAVTTGAAGAAIVAALGWVLYLPYYIGLQSQLEGVVPNLLFPSRFSQFFLMFGTFLVAVVLFLLLQTLHVRSKDVGRATLGSFLVVLFTPVLLFGLIAAAMAVLPQGRKLAQDLLADPGVQSRVGAQTPTDVLRLIIDIRLEAPWTHLILALLIGWTAGLVWVRLRALQSEGEGERTQPVASDLFASLLIGVALLLAFAPEFVYLRDIFGSRMNTVFKFYYQAWAMLGIAAAYGMSRLVQRTSPRGLASAAIVGVGLLALAGLWYPLMATPSKADYFQGQPTLNGLAYLRNFSAADMRAIEWIRENVADGAIVLEASGGSYSPEGAGRVSMSTGNPTLLGWDGHERQWRGAKGYADAVEGRPEALEAIYRTARPDELHTLLDQWGIDYVYVGALERNKYKISDVTLGRFESVLKQVYDQDGVRIYAR
jgi:YYY domain-containing protein